jgi:hypothetical protein
MSTLGIVAEMAASGRLERLSGRQHRLRDKMRDILTIIAGVVIGVGTTRWYLLADWPVLAGYIVLAAGILVYRDWRHARPSTAQ